MAASAYRGAERLTDERTGQVYDYTRRHGVEESGFFGWRSEWGRELLWNHAEAMEHRYDSRVAREAVVAIPEEVQPEVRSVLLRKFAADLRWRYAVAGIWDLHAPSRASDVHRNWHGHVQWTTRIVDEAGYFGAKTRILDNPYTSAKEIDWIRMRWETLCNDALAVEWERRRVAGGLTPQELEAGPWKIDRSSRETAGLDGPPLHHLSPAEVAAERLGARTPRGDENREMLVERERLRRERLAAQQQAVEERRMQEAAAREREAQNASAAAEERNASGLTQEEVRALSKQAEVLEAAIELRQRTRETVLRLESSKVQVDATLSFELERVYPPETIASFMSRYRRASPDEKLRLASTLRSAPELLGTLLMKKPATGFFRRANDNDARTGARVAAFVAERGAGIQRTFQDELAKAARQLDIPGKVTREALRAATETQALQVELSELRSGIQEAMRARRALERALEGKTVRNVRSRDFGL
ncbi:MAG TPA: MobA/MobL family protein [Longimicrobium sp.]